MKAQPQPARLPAGRLWALLAGFILLAACTGHEISAPENPPAECIPPGQTPISAEVVKVIDGDTIAVQIAGEEQRLRYIGINAPEMDSENQRLLAEQARDLNYLLVAEQEVLLFRDTSETDQFQRLLRYVYVDDLFVNYELVRRGLVRARDYPPDTACSAMLAEAERLAREEGLGIWAGR
jgi:micrococcal nuclease